MSQKFSNATEFFRTCQVGDEFTNNRDRARELYVATQVTGEGEEREVIFDCVTTHHSHKQYRSSVTHGDKARDITGRGYIRESKPFEQKHVRLLPIEDAPRFGAKRLEAVHTDAIAAYRDYAEALHAATSDAA